MRLPDRSAVIPDELHYTPEHEWVRREGDDEVTIGITDFAQDALGDIVYVSLPEVGEALGGGTSVGELESTKSVSDVYAPVSGAVVARNDALEQAPDLINSDPYGEGWLLRVKLDDPSALDSLLDAAGYGEQIAS
ncbi:MAG: glycine cleavage system protein GcvH [Actinomycetota bacterium]|nr:glycine cleavage system protein GcvH [Actinomycetota bacterium]